MKALLMACLVVLGGVLALNSYANAQEFRYALRQPADFLTGLGAYTILIGNETEDTVVIIGDDRAILPFGVSVGNFSCSDCDTRFLLKTGDNGIGNYIFTGDVDITEELDVSGASLFRDKMCFTQTDCRESINSYDDEHLDLNATTSIDFNIGIPILEVVNINKYGLGIHDGEDGEASSSSPLIVDKDRNGGIYIKSKNEDNGYNAFAGFWGESDTADMLLLSHGSGRGATRWGKTLGGNNEILAWNGELFIGTNDAGDDMILGTETIRAIKIDGSNQHVRVIQELEVFDTISASRDIRILSDNNALEIGAVGDASFYYDGTDAIINPKVVGSGLLKVDGNTNVTGNLTGNFYYGQMGEKFGYDTPLTFSFASAGVYYNVTNLTFTTLNGFTYTNEIQANGGSYLTAEYPGMYKADLHVSGKGKIAGGEYGIVITENFNKSINEQNCYASVSGTASFDSHSITCFFDLEAGDTVNVQAEDEADPTKDIEISSHNLNIMRIGD